MARLVTQTHMRTRARFGGPNSMIPLNRPDEAWAVPVTEAAA